MWSSSAVSPKVRADVDQPDGQISGVFSNAAVGTGGNRRCDGASATCRIPDHLDCGARS